MDQKKNNIKQTLITVFTGVFSVVISLSVMSMMQKQNDAIISFATLSDLQNMYSNPTEEDLKGKQFAVGNEIYEYSEGQWRSTGEITNAVAVRYITEEGAPGKDGADGVDGKDGVNGLDGKNGVDGINGTDGKDGVDGKDGEDGLDGKDGRDGVDGKDGKDGIDGKDGRDGRDGIDGKDGLTTSVNGVQHIDGNVTITLDDIEDGQQRLLSPIADETNLGQVMVGEGLSVDNTGLVSVNLGDGLEDDNGSTSAKLGEGLIFDDNGAIALNLGDGLGIDDEGKVVIISEIDCSEGKVLLGTANMYPSNWYNSTPKPFKLNDSVYNYKYIYVTADFSSSYWSDLGDHDYTKYTTGDTTKKIEREIETEGTYSASFSTAQTNGGIVTEVSSYSVIIKNGTDVSCTYDSSIGNWPANDEERGYVTIYGYGRINE